MPRQGISCSIFLLLPVDLAACWDPADRLSIIIILRVSFCGSPSPRLLASLHQLACGPALSQLSGLSFRISCMCSPTPIQLKLLTLNDAAQTVPLSRAFWPPLAHLPSSVELLLCIQNLLATCKLVLWYLSFCSQSLLLEQGTWMDLNPSSVAYWLHDLEQSPLNSEPQFAQP